MQLCLFAVSLLWPVANAITYNEEDGIKYLYTAISTYCGAPKFQPQYLLDWECGPSCTGAGSATNLSSFSAEDYGVYGVVGRYSDSCLVSFRGTSNGAGQSLDGEMDLIDFAPCSGCKIHQGLHKGYYAVQGAILTALAELHCSSVALTGHSLGGSLAIVATYDLGKVYTIKENYNYGSYRVGNPTFADAYDAKYLDVTFRVTHQKDPIPLGPTVNAGYQHVGGEIYYAGTVSQGYKICEGQEDLSCIDQYCPPSSCTLFGLTLFAISNAASHTTYMDDKVTIPTDGESCTYVAVSTQVAQQAYLAAASYCTAEELRTWSCGAPCEGVVGKMSNVQALNVPVYGANGANGTVRGFVGKWENRFVLSIADVFDPLTGLSILETEHTLVPFDRNETCPGCQVYGVVKHAYEALKKPLYEALETIGCLVHGGRSSPICRLVVTGHGFGAAVASLAAFELTAWFFNPGLAGVEQSFQFGSPRVGNDAWRSIYEVRLDPFLDRVTHHNDPYLQFPPTTAGFEHEREELFFDNDASDDPSSYIRCDKSGEDTNCSMKYAGSVGPLSDHETYMHPLMSLEMSEKSCGTIIKVMLV